MLNILEVIFIFYFVMRAFWGLGEFFKQIINLWLLATPLVTPLATPYIFYLTTLSKILDPPLSRPFGSFCSKLASHFKQPRRSGGRCGLQTRVRNNSTPNRPAPRTTFLKIRLGQNRYRDPIPDTERGPKTGSTRSRPVSEQSFSSTQTRRDFTSSDQPQGFERFSPIHTFQNGGYPSPARSGSAGGLAGQSRPEGCLFCSTDLEGSPEVSSFPLERDTSGICLSPVWSSSRTEIVHQNYEACRCHASPGWYSVDNLPGRSVVHACNTGGAAGGHGHSPLPPGKPRVCDKPREVSVYSNAKTRISGVRDQYHRYDSCIARRQGEVDQISVQDFAGATTSLSTGPFSTDWQAYGINSGCFSCALALSPPPKPQKSGSCEGKWLRFLFTPFTGSEGGNPMVASPPRSMERQSHPELTPRSSDRDRCLEGRVGSSLSRSENRRPVVSDGKEAPYKLPGVASRLVCGEKFHQEPIVCPCEASHGQHNCSSLCEPIRGYPFFSPLQFSACSVGMGPKEQHHAQRRTLCGPSQHGSRLGVASLPGCRQLAPRPERLQFPDANSRTLCDRSVCRQIEQPASAILQLEIRPIVNSNGCSTAGLVSRPELCLPALLPDHALPSQITGGGRGIDLNHASLANTSLVSQNSRHVCSAACSPPVLSGPIAEPTGRETPVTTERDLVVSRMACLKQSLQSEGNSPDASWLILAAWRPSTSAVYNSAWKKWHCWCDRRQIDPLCPTLANITSFLAWAFDEGFEYRTINTYRSALSGVLPPIEGFAVGQHPLVVRLLKGILNLRPAMPRYQRSWDVSLVLDYFRAQPENKDLPLKTLSRKLAMLLALTAPKRSSELQLLDTRFMRLHPEGVEFQLPGLTKTSSEISTVFLAKFEQDHNLCVLRCLQAYLEKTRVFRPILVPAQPNQLLISYRRPHAPVKSCTIARWIKSVLGKAGIDTTIFKAHSTRSASTSRAVSGGVSLEEVLKMPDWSGPSTFNRFYCRPRFDNAFARSVLESAE